MNFIEFQKKARRYPLFKTIDVFKWFPGDNKTSILNQLNLWTGKNYLKRVRRGVYQLSEWEARDPFILADFIYGPSYVSLESALNFYGMIPDVPQAVTSVTTLKTRIFRTQNHGTFFYHHVKPELFFGFKTVGAELSYAYRIAKSEKALLDFFYLKVHSRNPENFIAESRLEIPANFNFGDFKKWSALIDKRQHVFHELVKIIYKNHGNK